MESTNEKYNNEYYYNLYIVESNENNFALAKNELNSIISNCDKIIIEAKNTINSQTYQKHMCEMKLKEITTMYEKNNLLNIIKKSIEHIPNVEILTDKELSKIVQSMDRVDYTGHVTSIIAKARYIDLEPLVNKTIINKQRYPAFVLKEIVKQKQELPYLLPPQSFYILTYVTEYNDVVELGCRCGK